jgi:hypothetical protein
MLKLIQRFVEWLTDDIPAHTGDPDLDIALYAVDHGRPPE